MEYMNICRLDVRMATIHGHVWSIHGTRLTIHLHTQRAHQLRGVDAMQVFKMYWQVIIPAESGHSNWWPLLVLCSLYILKVSTHIIYSAL